MQIGYLLHGQHHLIPIFIPNNNIRSKCIKHFYLGDETKFAYR